MSEVFLSVKLWPVLLIFWSVPRRNLDTRKKRNKERGRN